MNQNTRIRNIFRRLPLAVLVAFVTLLAWRARPVMRSSESFNSIFPGKKFREKLNAPIPQWMQHQLDADFSKAPTIKAGIIEKVYQQIESRIGEQSHFFHYRILDNQLYKYVPDKSQSTPRDSNLEKAFKTLLSQTKVPDVDFILCPMDGLPEAYLTTDFYWMEDPQDQIPILAQAKFQEPLTRNVVLIPDQFSLSEDWYNTAKEIDQLKSKIRWEDKEEKVLWRGGFTDKGTASKEMPLFEITPRIQISLLSLSYPKEIDAGLNWIEPKQLKDKWRSILKNSASKADHLQCKYLPVLDGHMCTYPGYQWRLFSNSVAFKQNSNQVQWFYRALKPYEHYVPVENDMSDLLEVLSWAKNHDEDVKNISSRAQKFVAENLMYEDGYLYLFLVLNRYASQQEIDFKALKRETLKDPRWVCIQYRKRLALIKMLRRIRERIVRFSNSGQS